MSLQAYQRTQKTTENPRDTEYRLFGQVTRALIDARDASRQDKRLIDALDWNRRMWSSFATACTTDDNSLPESLRAQIISLSIWVTRYSGSVMRDGASLEPLIDINRTIMEGLSAQPEAKPAAS
jgi:flagellar protein FlaF